MQFNENKPSFAQPIFTMSLSQYLFNYIHRNQLIYNICWEDPAIDRKLMDIKSDSRIAMITSAGCNALDYLLDNPHSIDCVDLNYRQNALLDFKIQLILNTNHQTLFNFFGKGYHPQAKKIYFTQIRDSLRDNRYKYFWDKHIKHFENGSFFHSGTSGKMAQWIVKRLKKKKLLGAVIDLLNETDPTKRTADFEHIFSKLFPEIFKPVINSDFAMSMIGVPKAQKKLIVNEEGSVFSFIQKRLRHVLTRLDNRNNYFWKYYLQGGLIEETEGPNYLKKGHFEMLQSAVDRIRIHTKSLEEALVSSDTSFTHFVLLDHQDWMAQHRPDLLENEWNAIVNKSTEDASYLLRSASFNRQFIPNWVKELISFKDEQTQQLHYLDRVGTYASTHFGKLQISKVQVL